MIRRAFSFIAIAVGIFSAATAHAGELARGDLAIVGLGLELDRAPVSAAVGVPSSVQTIFGGRTNDQAPAVPGLTVAGDLTGPGIEAPITLSAVPGKRFTIPALQRKGEYVLQNVRLLGPEGEFLQQAVPSFAIIHVADALQTRVRVRQLTPDELRERGILIDARNQDVYGAATVETLADGAVNRFDYDHSGAQSVYTDPSTTPEVTSTENDWVGRPVTRHYQDGTTERFVYEGPRLREMTDRQGRTQRFVYNSKGQLEEIRDANNVLQDVLGYDHGGRLVSWKNAAAEITWSNFDLAGNPRRTAQKRFRNDSGFTDGIVRDEFVQEHRWNELGERVRFSMPVAPGQTLAQGWTKWLRQGFDAAGNLIEITRLDSDTAADGQSVMTGSFHAAGRPEVRTVFAAGNGAPIVRRYEYDPTTSLPSRFEVKSNGVTVAGNEVTYDGLQIAEARLLGVGAGERVSRWGYDARGRVIASLYGVLSSAPPPGAPVPGRAREQLTPADFRDQQERTSRFTTAPPAGVDTSKIDPPTTTFAERAGGGHKIDAVTRGDVVRPFGWDGAQRVSDGRFVYTFDAKGRLLTATEGTSLRIAYSYSGAGRLVGRRVERGGSVESDTTFVWDAIADRLIAAFDAQTGQLLKQVIHGDLAYDDPLETTTWNAASGTPAALYPIFAESATSTMQAVLDARGEVVARNLSNDPYGADDLALNGPAVDRVTVDTTAEAVHVTLHVTEPLDAATIETGARLTIVADATGEVLRTTTVEPALHETNSVRWTFTPDEWTALTAATPGAALSVAATSTLRAITWSDATPILPAPEWAKELENAHTSAALPFELREPLATLPSPAAPSSATLYEVEHLSLLAGGGSDALIEEVLAARFQALPFAEPATGLVYARARWYDPSTGSFLTPDPMGYVDSSNLYAFAGGDPVNRRDPTGEDAYDDKLQAYIAWFADQHDALWQTRKQLSWQLSGPDPGLAIAEDRIAASRMMTFGGNADSAAVFIGFARARGNRAVLGMSNEQIHAELVKDEGVKAVGAALIGGLRPGLVQLQSKFSSGWKALGEAVGDVVDFRWGSRAASQRGSVTIRKGPGSFVPKKESMRPSAAQYQEDVGEGLPGHAYRVPYDNPNPRGKPYVDYDGVQGTFPVDAKLAVVTRPKTVGQAMRQADSLRQTSSKGIWKAPNMSEALRARRVIREANATDVLFVVVERKP